MAAWAPRRSRVVLDAAVAYLSFLLLCSVQSPGQIVADTKYDLVANPGGFLQRALSMWTGQSFGGQVQNQAYGYLFPQGPFFLLGNLAGVPEWFVQRLWWALVLTVAFGGAVRLAGALRIGTRGSRVLGGLAYALAPRMLAEIGSISSEVWPVALAPWVMLPIVRALHGHMTPRRAGAGAALALALMGAVNAVATLMACAPAVLWWLLHRPNRTWWRLAAWWVSLSAAVCLWWIVPLMLLGRVSPPFLDFIESAAVTTRWASPAEVLRGAATWVPFVATDRVAGVALVSVPALVLASGVLAAAGLAGLLKRGMPGRGRLLSIAVVGLVLMSAAWVGPAGGGFAEPLRAFLDGDGAPLRNIHKAEPLLRLPLALGLAHLLARVPLSWTALARPERHRSVALGMVVTLAFAITAAPAWTLRLAPAGGHAEVPDYWGQAAQWLADNAPRPRVTAGGEVGNTDEDPAAAARALVVPGSAFGTQLWGITRDEPLQPLATTPWAVRDSIPLQPAPAIRALDAVQELLADGRPAPGLAATLASLGVGYLVVRNDLSAESNAPRPLLVHQTLARSPGVQRVAEFGQPVGGQIGTGSGGTGGAGSRAGGGVDGAGETLIRVEDAGLRPAYPAIEIYQVQSSLGSGSTGSAPPRSPTAPYLVDAADLPVVAGGPESLARLDDLRAAQSRANGSARTGQDRTTRILAADAAAVGLNSAAERSLDPAGPERGLIVTDTPVDRERDFGRVDHSLSAARAPGDLARGRGSVPDYPAAVASGTELSEGRWTGGKLSASSSASDSSQPGPVQPGSSPAAAVDGDPATSWRSGGFGSGFGQWLRLDLDMPIDRGLLRLTIPKDEFGPALTAVDVRTDTGTTTAYPIPGQALSIALPPGATRSIKISATGFADGSRGNRFAIAELALRSGDRPVPITHTVALPELPAGADIAGWQLGQGLPGREECVPDGNGPVRCSTSLGVEAEEPGRFSRLLSVPSATSVRPELLLRPRPGTSLSEVLRGDPASRSREVTARAPSDISDPRGSALAAVDGDRSTSWYAPAMDSPALELALPKSQVVGSVRLWLPAVSVPAAPTKITVEAGRSSRTVNLSDLRPNDDGSVMIPLTPVTSNKVTVRIDGYQDVRDGRADSAARIGPGIAEAQVYDISGARIGLPAAEPNAPVRLSCQDGPQLTIGGNTVRFRVSTSREALATGQTVRAEACATSPVQLAAGRVPVDVQPGEAFTVDSLALVGGGTSTRLGTREQRARGVQVGDWSDTRRTLAVPSSSRSRVLVIPESVNAGWRGRLVDAETGAVTEAQAVTINGWQQGWMVPASASAASLVLDYPLTQPYRWALATGPFALLLVLALFLLRGRDRAGARTVPWRGSGLISVAAMAGVAGILGGWYGIGVAVLVTGAALFYSRYFGARRAQRALHAGVVVGVCAGAALLSRQPWLDSAGYAGDSLAVQLLTLAALSAAILCERFPVTGDGKTLTEGVADRRHQR